MCVCVVSAAQTLCMRLRSLWVGSRSLSLPCPVSAVCLSVLLSGAVGDGRSEMHCQFCVSSCHVVDSPVPYARFKDMPIETGSLSHT